MFRAVAAAVVIALLLGLCAAMLVTWLVLRPFYREQALKNGAPFQQGDRVGILVGPHRDRVSSVYALWQGECVRVELVEKEKKKRRDIFGPTELLRVETGQPAGGLAS